MKGGWEGSKEELQENSEQASAPGRGASCKKIVMMGGASGGRIVRRVGKHIDTVQQIRANYEIGTECVWGVQAGGGREMVLALGGGWRVGVTNSPTNSPLLFSDAHPLFCFFPLCAQGAAKKNIWGHLCRLMGKAINRPTDLLFN